MKIEMQMHRTDKRSVHFCLQRDEVARKNDWFLGRGKDKETEWKKSDLL